MTANLNRTVADHLRRMAVLLVAEGANPFRVQAYRRAADTVETLPEDLRRMIATGGAAALRALPGIGPSLSARIVDLSQAEPDPIAAPSPALLLEVDAEYRRRAATGALPRVAPRRHNPSRAAWLPVLHTRRGPWAFTALFSNTDRAHDLHRTADWVVLQYRRPGGPIGHCTVVTAEGRRVVLGGEAEDGSGHPSRRPPAAASSG